MGGTMSASPTDILREALERIAEKGLPHGNAESLRFIARDALLRAGKGGGMSTIFAQQGWQCPTCLRVYSPTTGMCYYCPPKVTTSDTTSPAPKPERRSCETCYWWQSPHDEATEKPCNWCIGKRTDRWTPAASDGEGE
jgi:hypothetical protein